METEHKGQADVPASGTVLIIDDNHDLCAMYAAGLGQAHLTVVTAHDVQSGWQAATKCTPDVVLLDIGLADGDGLELLTRLRAHPWPEQHPRIVMFTNFDDPGHRATAQARGADGYLVKASIRMQQLAQTVRGLVEAGRPTPG